MKLFTTPKASRIYSSILIIGVISFLIAGCSTSRNEESPDVFNNNDDGKKTYVFFDDGVEWEAHLDNNKITELYKNGEKLPHEQISNYEDKIYERIAQTEEDVQEFHADMKHFEVDMEDFQEDIARLQEEIKDKQFTFNFDHEKFSADMQKAANEIRLAFESGEFKENMKKLNEDLKNIKVDIDTDKLNEEINRATKSLKDVHVDIDMAELQAEIAEMKKELLEKSEDLKHAKKQYRKYNKFMDDLRAGLQEDGIIKNKDEEFDMIFNSKELKINGKAAPSDIHKKYKEMYENRFGEMDDDMNIKTNE